MTERNNYLLMKRGLYYRPAAQGYTSIKDEAGRYSASAATPEDGVTAIHEDAALEYSPAGNIEVAAPHATAKVAAMKAEIARLKAVYSSLNDDVMQILGKALGFPWYADDQTTFPGATKADGICPGEQVAESMAEFAAKRIAKSDDTIRALRMTITAAREALEESKALVEHIQEFGGVMDRIFVDAADETVRRAMAEIDTLLGGKEG
ncbi:hypothetical protein L2U69_12030 [Zavarzinia compransoris]|nr:hypothetical protein [Zavarzinia marina]